MTEIRTYFLFAMLVAFVVLTLPEGCGSSGGGNDSSNPGKSVAQTPATKFVVSSVQDLGPIEISPAVTMRDGGFSAIFQGRMVWIFGDTMLNTPNVDDKMMLSNSCCSTYDIDAGDGLAGFDEPVDDIGTPKIFFPFTEEETAFNLAHFGDTCEEQPCHERWAIWPGSMVVDEVKGQAYIFYHKVRAGHGGWDFNHVGHSIAVWKDYSLPVERPVFGYYEQYPTLFFVEDRNGFGSATLLVGQQLYVYGCGMLGDIFEKSCRIARVPMADILDKTAWNYFSGNGTWSSELSEAIDVFSGNNMMSVFYNPYIERFMTVYSLPLGVETMLRTSPQPEGPWSSPTVLFSGETPKSDVGWIYDALAHPELSQDDGKSIYITYTRQMAPRESEMRLVLVQLERSY
jgi:hypothetical protein